MDFGVFSEFHIRPGMTHAEAFEESFYQVDASEKLGLDTVWLAEHHFDPGRCPVLSCPVLSCPLPIASAVAARTNRIRIGLAVHVIPLGNPLRIAEEAATVDHIAKGRFDFGIGRSGFTKIYKGYNIEYSESKGRFFEALEVIVKAWDEEKLSHDGQYYSYHDVTVVPKPFQKPHPPIRLAIASPETFPEVGRLGYPIFISASAPIPETEGRLAEYRRAWKEAGHPGDGDVMLRIPCYLAETAERARSEPEESTMHGIKYIAEELISSAGRPEIVEKFQRILEMPYEEILKGGVLHGTPGEVSERLHEYEETLGISGVVLEMNFGGNIPYECVLNSMRLLADQVMPHHK